MIFHENCLPAEISYLIFFPKLRKMSENLSSAAVVIGTLRVNFEKSQQTTKKAWTFTQHSKSCNAHCKLYTPIISQNLSVINKLLVTFSYLI